MIVFSATKNIVIYLYTKTLSSRARSGGCVSARTSKVILHTSNLYYNNWLFEG